MYITDVMLFCAIVKVTVLFKEGKSGMQIC